MANIYKRILLKLSGEALMGRQQFGHDLNIVRQICEDVKEVHGRGIEICIVVGGGNIFRGATASGLGRATADYMGMLATVINALMLQNMLESLSVDTRVMSAIPMTTICEQYTRRRALRHMQKNRVVIFAAGTGHPFFTTDTAAALRSVEMDCDALFKGTQVDGVYCSDPKKNVNAKKFNTLDYAEILSKNLQVMDSSAIALAQENKMPIVVFDIHKKGNFGDVVSGKGDFTIIKE